MKILLCLSLVLPLFAQTGSQQSPNRSTSEQAPQSQTASDQTSPSVTQPKPGGQVIKQKDLYDSTGYLHPFRRMPKYILSDQKAIWASPFHTSKKNAKWWASFGAGTVALIATDKYMPYSCSTG